MNAPFMTAEAAWLHTMRAIKTPGPRDAVIQEQADGVVKALDRLFRQGRIKLAHVRILRAYGERGTAPSPRVVGERGDHRLWREALDALDDRLTMLGLVARRAA